MDPLDIFDLDTEIDFETAYRMLDNFDHIHGDNNTNSNSKDNHFASSHIEKQLPLETNPHHTTNDGVDSVHSPHVMMTLPPTNQLSPLISHHVPLHNTATATATMGTHNSDITHHFNSPPVMSNEFDLQINHIMHSPFQTLNNNNNTNVVTLTQNDQRKPNGNNQPSQINRGFLLHNHLSSQGVGDELLSTMEATAIERFLDTLLSSDPQELASSQPIVPTYQIKKKSSRKESKKYTKPKVKKPEHNHNSPKVQNISLILKKELAMPKPPPIVTTRKITREDNKIATPIIQEKKIEEVVLIDPEYIPHQIKIPEITLDSITYPDHLPHDPESTEFKKWKHVEVEKLRRNQTKKTFDQLIAMHNKHLKRYVDGSKRVAKYTQLNQVKEDIRNIIKANQILQEMIEKSCK